MAHVITQSCCNDAACVAVCPVDCIHPRPDEPDYHTAEMLYIDPQVCIDCGACARACPIDAVFPEDKLPDAMTPYLTLADAFYRNGAPRAVAPALTSIPLTASVRRLRVAIVGSGPAGCYAAAELLARKDVRAEVHMFDRLPTPWGLIRAGVAPDHQQTKTIADTFAKTAAHADFHFHLGVEVGRDITHDELAARHHAVIYAVGASGGRRLGIAGEQLPGSHSAAEFVAWYNGHPDHAADRYDLSGERAVVIGNGNVALDIARVLLADPDTLARTDVPDYALDALRHSNIREVVLVGRRGPAEAAYTSPELRALANLRDVDVVTEEPITRSGDPKADLAAELTSRPVTGQRRITLRFFHTPVEILGDTRVTGIRLARAEARSTVDTGLVIRSIGFRGTAVDGLPFDDERGQLPNVAGRLVDPESGTPIAGVYVTGWIKRGPTGVIGTNKQCAAETVAALVNDRIEGRLTDPDPSATELGELLAERDVVPVDERGWQAIDAYERDRGKAEGRPRIKETSPTAIAAIAATNR